MRSPRLAQSFNSFMNKIRHTICEVATTVHRVTRSQSDGIRSASRPAREPSVSRPKPSGGACNHRDAVDCTRSGHGADRANATSAQSSAKRGQSVLAATQAEISRLAADVEQAAAVIHELEQDGSASGRARRDPQRRRADQSAGAQRGNRGSACR